MYEQFQWTKASFFRNDLTKVYEPIQPLFLVYLAQALSDAVFVDVGANVGIYSIFLGSQPSVSKVYACEATEDCCRELSANARLNSLEHKIQIVSKVISRREGEILFREQGHLSGSSGVVESYLFNNITYLKDEVYQGTTIDTICQASGREIILKIDVEGHEFPVLEGGRNLLEANTGFLQVESHAANPHHSDVRELLEARGWKQFLRVGWDYYYSNREDTQNSHARQELVDNMLSFVVDQSINGTKPARKRLNSTVVVELRRSFVQRLRRVLGR